MPRPLSAPRPRSRLAVPCLAALALFFSPSAGAADTELVVWHAYRAAEKAAIEKVAANYNAAHPGTKVTTLAVPYDAFADKISAAVPRGKGPDVFIFAQDRLGGWIEAGNTVEPVDFFLDKETKDRFMRPAASASPMRTMITIITPPCRMASAAGSSTASPRR